MGFQLPGSSGLGGGASVPFKFNSSLGGTSAPAGGDKPGSSFPSWLPAAPAKPAAGAAPAQEESDEEDEKKKEELMDTDVVKADLKDEDTMFEVRAKLLKLGADIDDKGRPTDKKRWRDMGVGTLQALKHKTTDKRRLLLRNESSGKILLNAFLYPKQAFKRHKQNIQFFGMVDEPELDADGKLTGQTKPANVMFSVKVAADQAEDTLNKLLAAVPK